MGTVFGKNTTSSSITVAGHKVYYIDSTDAEIVEVQDGSNVKYNAFKYTLSGTPYWYVIDGEHDTWTDDLSAWGYSEVQPVVELPEVTLMAYSGNEWNYPASFNTNPLTFVSGEQAQLYIASGTSFSYESDKVYSVGEYQNPSGTTTGRYGFSVVSVNSKIGCKNISGGSITIQRMSVYRCSDSTATVVTVYNSSNVAYNAFKYSLSGTPYWYVIDGEHDTWTDDLSAWGYSEVQPVETLPTVTTEGDFASYNWLRVSSAESVSGGGNTSNLTTDGTDYPNYNTGNSYAILQWQQSGGTTSGRVEFSIVNANGKIQAHNNTSGALTFYQARVAVCSSNQATVVTVYNSSNVAYNAFKFTANNTDYYYVLDGTQTDWTDDLAGIGYSLYLKAWFTSDKSGKSIDTSYPGNGGLLYDSQGAFIAFQSGSTYTTVAVYNTSQQAVSGIDSSNFTLEDNGGGYLSFKNRSSKAPTALYVEYTVS